MHAERARGVSGFGIEDNILVWLCRHSGWLISRFHARTDGLTPCGELAEFGEQVYVKETATRNAKLDDRWISPMTWIGKAERPARDGLSGREFGGATCRCDGFHPVNCGRPKPWRRSARPGNEERRHRGACCDARGSVRGSGCRAHVLLQ